MRTLAPEFRRKWIWVDISIGTWSQIQVPVRRFLATSELAGFRVRRGWR